MESTQTQYRLMSVKDKSFRTEKRTTTYAPSKKSRSRQFETQLPPKASHNYSKKPPQKHKEYAKYQNYGPKAVYYPVYKPSESQSNGAYYPSYNYCPQYYVPSPMGYPELLMPVYGYPVCYTEKSYCETKATGETSPQELGNSGCPTVASEEELNNLNGEECEFKVMCNGNLIHTECYNEPGSEPNACSVLSSSDYDDFVLPFTGSEPKSEAISLPSFLTE